MTDRPLSWLMIERGWAVVTADGTDVGRIESVVGDENADIFDGLAVSTSAVSVARYVPAEQVGEIAAGRVTIDVNPAALDQLPAYEPPASERELVVGGPSLWDRIAGWFRRPG